MPGPVRDLCAQDLPVGRGTQSGRVEGVEEDGCRLGVRIPLPTGGLEQALPLCSSVLRESARGSGAGGKRAVPVVRNQSISIPGVRDRHERSEQPTRLVILQGESPCAVNYL